MFWLTKMGCRLFQLGFRIALPILPYRQPKIVSSCAQLDRVLKTEKASSVLIVTDHGKMICDLIDEITARGSTILDGHGGFQGDKKQVVMCACSNKEMYQIQTAIREADPSSFLIILESNEVHGEGFHMLKIGEKQ